MISTPATVAVIDGVPRVGLDDAEVERVGRGTSKYLMVESFRNEREKANLLYWQLTCLSFHSPETWAWIYGKCGYTGDHGFIFFE